MPDAPRDEPPGIPRWLKASAIVVAVVLLVIVAVMLLSGGDHGPGPHLGSAHVDAIAQAAAVARP